MSTGVERTGTGEWRSGRVPVEELARRQGVRPAQSMAEMAEDGVFGSDEEVEEFLAHVRAARQADLG